MGKTVYICEKPDQGRSVAAALGKPENKGQYINVGSDIVVTWGFGHLVELYEPHDYNEEWKKWSWDAMPVIPDTFKKKPVTKSIKQLNTIKGLLENASLVVVATDSDREGETIAYGIINEARYKGPIKRLWISDLTPAAIREANSKLLPGEKTKPLYFAGQARAYADWIVGMNMTRAATLKLRKSGGGGALSIGRVQTPTLAILVNLDKKISNFKPQDYFELQADVIDENGSSFKMNFAPPADKRILDREKIQELQRKAEGFQGPISVKTEAKQTASPQMFDLGSLQQACNNKFKWSATKTDEVLQNLYEKHKVVTYPRTDCRYLPEEHKKNIPGILQNLLSVPELKSIKQDFPDNPVVSSKHYNDKKITAHHAIVPTSQAPNLAGMTSDERALYTLIARSYVAAHMPPYHYLSTSITFMANQVPFSIRGTQPQKAGWKAAFGADEESNDDGKKAEKDIKLPNVKDGDTVTAQKVSIISSKTKPPKRLTEATLLQKMENISGEVEDIDPRYKKILKETSGLGTPATRASVLKRIQDQKYVTSVKNQLRPTEAGIKLIEAIQEIAPSYADPIQTAIWEDALSSIAEGKLDPRKFVSSIIEKVRKDVVAVQTAKNVIQIEGAETKGGSGTRKFKPANTAKMTKLKVSFDDKARAKKLGAIWSGEQKAWYAPEGANLDAFKQEGFL